MVGYGLQLAIYSVLLASMNTRFAITEFESRDALYITFNCLVVLFGLISILAVIWMPGRTVRNRILLVTGSIALFAATWFGFMMCVISIAFS